MSSEPIKSTHLANGGRITDKIPLLPVDPQLHVDLWYEGPTFLIADNPQEMAVHPTGDSAVGTLVNGLLQANRWLAEMETSRSPGVIHLLRPQDRGLTLIAKSDEMAEQLRQSHQEGALRFSYRVQVPSSHTVTPCSAVSLFDSHPYGEITVYDLDSPWGDTARIAADWLGDPNASANFICYQITVPTPAKSFQIGLGRRILLPDIDLYTAAT